MRFTFADAIRYSLYLGIAWLILAGTFAALGW